MSTQCYDCVATLKNLGTVGSADALREFESLAVGRVRLNCELFAGTFEYSMVEVWLLKRVDSALRIVS